MLRLDQILNEIYFLFTDLYTIHFSFIGCSFNGINAVPLNNNILSYPSERSTLIVKEEIRPIIPSTVIKGIYEISPDLPLGLSVNNKGIISGIPQQITPLTEYAITVQTVEGIKYSATIYLESIY